MKGTDPKFYGCFKEQMRGRVTKRGFAIGFTIAAAALVMSTRPAGAQNVPFSTNESFSSCTESLCIDAPPQGPQGLDGSGGWGWNSSAKAPVSSLFVGKPATFTVTVMQPDNVPLCGSGPLTITLTYSSRDFTLNSTDSTGNPGVDPFDRGGVETFSYNGDFLCHKDQSVAFTFTPQHTTNTALVTATVHANNQQASETFPVAIQKKDERH